MEWITCVWPNDHRIHQRSKMIAPDGRWIFVHIQKTGGNAVRTALGVEIDDRHKHFLALELQQIYGQETWNKAFKFAFVRNPWERLVSWWSMIDGARSQFARIAPPNKFIAYVLQSASTFQEFITHCTDEIIDSDGKKSIFRNQIDYLVDRNGTKIVDFIGRFEHLQEDFDEIAKRLGLPKSELPLVNKSKHRAYMDYYNPETATAVGRYYARDIETFSYRFG